MLGWLVTRTASIPLRTDARKFASVKFASGPVSTPSRHFGTPVPTIRVAHCSVLSTSTRNYAKLVKRSVKSKVGKAPAKSEPMLYDEDFEDDETLGEGSLETEDATQMEKKDASYLNSSAQIEDILRNSLPPDMVDAAIAEHRRIYPAFKSGKLSASDAQKAGISRRIDTRQFLQNLSDTASNPLESDPFAAISSSNNLENRSGASGTSSSSSNTQTAKSSTTRPSTSRKPLDSKALEKAAERDTQEIDELDPDDLDGSIKEQDVTDVFGDTVVGDMVQESGLASSVLKRRKLKRSVGAGAKKPILLDPSTLLHHRVEMAKELEAQRSLNASEESLSSDEVFESVKAGLKKLSSSKKSSKKSEILGKKSGIINLGTQQKTVAKESGDPVSRVAMKARELAKQGDWSGALALFKSVGEDYDQVKILSTFGEQAFEAKQYDVAGQAAIAAFNLDSSDIRANMVAARVFVVQHDPSLPDSEMRLAMALQHADRALEQHPDWPDLLALKGSVVMCRRKYKSACLYFKAALAQLEKPEFRLQRTARNFIHRDYAKSLAGRGLYKEALSHLKFALQLDPKNVEIIGLLGELHERGFNDLETAATFYKMAVDVQPEDIPSLIRLGQLYADPIYQAQNLESARSCYERAMILKPHSDFWFPLGWLSMHLGENDRALACLQRAAQLDENEQNRWTSKVLLAEIFAFDPQGNNPKESLEKAVTLYEAALEERGDAEVQLNLAKCLLRLDRFQDAQILLEAIKGEDPDNCDLKCVLVEAYHVGGRLNEAARELEVVIKEHPLEPMPQFMKGKYLYDAAEYVAAMPYLERSVANLMKPQLGMTDLTQVEESASEGLDSLASLIKAGSKSGALGSKSESGNESDVASVLKELESKVREIDPAQLEALRAQAQNMANVNMDSASKLPAGSILREGTPEVPVYAGEAFRLLARCYFEAEMWQEAKKSIGYALGYESESENLLTALGECLLNLGDVDEAITTFRKASVLHPYAVRPPFQLGNLLMQQSLFEQAITYLEKALNAIELRMEPSTLPEGVETDVSEDEMADMIRVIYSNLSACCTQMATLDRSNYAKYVKLSKQWAQRAQEFSDAA